MLIKIDTEGTEYRVLRGALQALQKNRPKIIFECWGDSERERLFYFFATQSYLIHRLPWTPEKHAQALDLSEFVADLSINYIAIPI